MAVTVNIPLCADDGPSMAYASYLHSSVPAPKWREQLILWVRALAIHTGAGGQCIRLYNPMQQKFPGAYKVCAQYNNSTDSMDIALVFDTPEDEIVWRLVWQ